MSTISLDRRSFLATSSMGVIAIILSGCSGQTGIAAQHERLLTRMAQHLYPHTGLPEAEFQASVAPLISAANTDPQLAGLILQGAHSLDDQADGNWLSAETAGQVDAMASLEESDFFAEVQSRIRGELYSRPAVWELIGYEGPSLEFGGYLERGFDDIDWLPEA